MRRILSVPVQDTESYSRSYYTHTNETQGRRCLQLRETLSMLEVAEGSILHFIHLHFNCSSSSKSKSVLFEISSHYLKSCYLELAGIFVPIFPSINLKTTCAVACQCLTISVLIPMPRIQSNRAAVLLLHGF